jgi:hypothetical protein
MTKRIPTHLLVGRETTACGSGEANPAFTTRKIADADCVRCLRLKARWAADAAAALAAVGNLPAAREATAVRDEAASRITTLTLTTRNP